jgi:hypothetical protein
MIADTVLSQTTPATWRMARRNPGAELPNPQPPQKNGSAACLRGRLGPAIDYRWIEQQIAASREINS